MFLYKYKNVDQILMATIFLMQTAPRTCKNAATPIILRPSSSVNSNMTYSLQGLNNYISSDVTAEYWLNRVYPPKVRKAHKSGDIHIHDLSLLSVYCVGWDLQDLLLQGFKGVKGKVESSPPKHFRSALGQIVNFFYTLQGEAAGAQAISNFDTLLAPFVRYDNLEYGDVKQALQEFMFQSSRHDCME